MPYTSYSNLLPEDVAALFAYFRLGVSPVSIPNKANEIPFPLSMRWPLTYWRLLFAPTPEPYVAPVEWTADVARGGYLVEGLGHCGECHTSRNAALALRATTPKDGSRFLAGARIEGYFAPSLRSEGPGSLADWNAEDIAAFLMTGVNRHGIAFASMSEVIVNSTQHLTQHDALAMAAFLKTLTTPGRTFAPAFTPNDDEHSRLKAGDASKPGAQLYLDNCAACHRPDGKGYEGVFPSLAGNPVVLAESADSIIAIVSEGATTPRTQATPARFTMPSLHWRLGDEGVAKVATFVRSSWGNQAGAVDIADVRAVRKLVAQSEAQ
ncbi:cytochrome c [Povalibacter sp.]|uniref:c-type cytochrome n=1 Tax=Povalibacter sp. TaxID=1962978 RepID=UPI002F3F6A51